MIVRTRIFELSSRYYRNLSEVAAVMEISVSQIYRVREGKRHINQKFIVGAMKAFPNHNLDDLFYLTPELPAVTNRPGFQRLETRSSAQPIAGERRATVNNKVLV